MKGSMARKKFGGKTHYYAVIDLPHLKGEKRQQKWIPLGTNCRQAEADFAEAVLKVRNTHYLNGKNVRFKDMSEDYLFNTQKRLAASTYKRYASIVKNLNEHFGETLMCDIEPYHVEQYFKLLFKQHLSTNTVAKYRLVLGQICNYAMELKVINTIPIAKLKRSSRSDNYSFQVWSSQEVSDFLLCIADSPLYVPVYIAVHTGMRLGEVLALKWCEIDLKHNQLTVRYSMDINGQLKTTKTKQSRRTIKLIPEVVKMLTAHKHTQKLNKMRYGNDYFKNDFVCTFPNGQPLSRNYVSTTFRRKVRQYKFPVIRFHDLRHTFATIALSHNVHTKVVQEILGHSSSRTTLDIYSHVIPTMQTQSLEILAKAFEN